MKAVVGALIQEKALVGAFSMIVEPMDRFAALIFARVKCDGNGNKCPGPGLDTAAGQEVTRTLSVQIADPHLSLMINITPPDTQLTHNGRSGS